MALQQLENDRIAARYALALLDLAWEDGHEAAATVASQLQTLRTVTDGTVATCFGGLTNAEELQTFWQNILSQFGAHSLISRCIAVMIDHHRGALVTDLVKQYQDLYDQRRGMKHVNVTSAAPLSASAQQALETELKPLLDCEFIELSTQTNPEILGGLILEIGSRKIDDSVRGKLQSIRQSLLSSGHE